MHNVIGDLSWNIYKEEVKQSDPVYAMLCFNILVNLENSINPRLGYLLSA